MWIPDTYQGASASFVAFLSVAPKAAGVAALSLVFLHGLAAHRAVWMPPLVALAIVSMAVGNVLALAQTDLRRLLGYSGIAQMGYVLVAVAASTELGMGMTLFFLAAYLFTNLGAFLVVHASGASTIDDLGGLSARSPRLAAALLCFILSLAGIPFVVGFWAKLYVFLAAWKAGLGGVVVVALALAVLSLFYYLRVLRAAYMTDGRAEAPRSGPPLRAAIALCALAVIALGLYPRPLVEDASRAGRDLFSHTK
jgi:NADH-quinone oxidoreductase subunit N